MKGNSYELGFVVACLVALALIYLTIKVVVWGVIWWMG